MSLILLSEALKSLCVGARVTFEGFIIALDGCPDSSVFFSLKLAIKPSNIFSVLKYGLFKK